MKISTIVIITFFCFCKMYSQENNKCIEHLKLFDIYRKSKKYDLAYKPLKKLRDSCSGFNRAIYVYGDDVLKHKIENSSGEEKVSHINDLMLLFEEYNKHFATKYPTGKMLVDKANLAHTYKKELAKSDIDLFNMYDIAYKTDKINFKNPKGLYIYFDLTTKIYENKEIKVGAVFKKYEDISSYLQKLKNDYYKKVEILNLKIKSNIELTKFETKRKESYNTVLSVIKKIEDAMYFKLKEIIK